MATPKVNDSEWVTNAFMLPKQSIIAADERRDLLRNAAYKFTDTTLGGNFAINPPPQFTRHADLKVKGSYSLGKNKNERSSSKGMGRYYSEAIDDNSFNVHMGFGVPAFNSLTTFFTEFYNTEASSLARTGRGRSLIYTLTRVAGFVVTAPLLPIVMLGRAIRFATGTPSSKYYSLKPTMPLYWNSVNAIANSIAVNMGIVPRAFDTSDETGSAASPGYDQTDIELYHKMLPELYRPNGGIDVYAMATRAQRMADRNHRRMIETMENASSFEDLRARMQDFVNTDNNTPEVSGNQKITGNSSIGINNYIAAWESIEASTPPDSSDDITEEDSSSWYENLADFAAAELRDGARYITFRVNGAEEASESFNNSTRESDIASTINSMSSSARSKRFTMAGGNIGEGAIANTLEKITGAVVDVATGALDTLGVGGIAALGGSAFADIPEVWESSSFSAPTSSYTIELRSPYGNKMSRFQNLYIPLSMLLAAALPLSTGKHSYTSPFLVELYAKGRTQIRLGMIDSLEIRRGVGNLGWTAEGEPLGIDVSFTVKDLSSIMHMPISMGQGLFDEDTAFNDYMSTLGSLSLVDQVYPTKKFHLNLTRKLTNYRTWLSTSRYASWASGTLPARIMTGITRATSRE